MEQDGEPEETVKIARVEMNRCLGPFVPRNEGCVPGQLSVTVCTVWSVVRNLYKAFPILGGFLVCEFYGRRGSPARVEMKRRASFWLKVRSGAEAFLVFSSHRRSSTGDAFLLSVKPRRLRLQRGKTKKKKQGKKWQEEVSAVEG